MLQKLVGKKFQIYPGDTYKKTGILLEVSDLGFLFKITSYSGKDKEYEVGKLHFISTSKELSFKEI